MKSTTEALRESIRCCELRLVKQFGDVEAAVEFHNPFQQGRSLCFGLLQRDAHPRVPRLFTRDAVMDIERPLIEGSINDIFEASTSLERLVRQLKLSKNSQDDEIEAVINRFKGVLQ